MSKDRSYEVGYGKPPKHTRFKPGQSGNPKGRKPGSKNVMTLLEQTLFDTVKVRENGKLRRVPAIQACLMHLRNQAIKGDPRESSSRTAPETVNRATDLALLQELQRMLREDPANGISFATEDDNDCGRNAGDPT